MRTMEQVAGLLRDAARVLRERAEGANPRMWGWDVAASADQAYAACVRPGMGVAVADALDYEARLVDGGEQTVHVAFMVTIAEQVLAEVQG